MPHDVVLEDVLENDVALEHPHVCMGGTVNVGHLVENEEGETIEVFEACPCRLCPNFALWGFSEVRFKRILGSPHSPGPTPVSVPG